MIDAYISTFKFLSYCLVVFAVFATIIKELLEITHSGWGTCSVRATWCASFSVLCYMCVIKHLGIIRRLEKCCQWIEKYSTRAHVFYLFIFSCMPVLKQLCEYDVWDKGTSCYTENQTTLKKGCQWEVLYNCTHTVRARTFSISSFFSYIPVLKKLYEYDVWDKVLS